MTVQPRRVIVFPHIRTASHVFYQILRSHPIFQAVEPNTFTRAFLVGTDSQSSRSKDINQRALRMSDDEVSKISYQSKLDDLERMMAKAELNGKWFLASEHPFLLMSSAEFQSHISVPGGEILPMPVIEDRMLDVTADSESPSSELKIPGHVRNPTLLPDRIFFSVTPIITIRHPARVIPSHLRALNKMFGISLTSDPSSLVLGTTFRIERLVFDAFKSFDESRAAAEGRAPRVPIVVDGERLVRHPQSQMEKVCEALGIDAALLKYSWEAKLNINGLEGFIDTFDRSTGVISDPRYEKPLDLQEEVRSWEKEWDEQTAKVMEEMVTGVMEDYEYLLQYSI
ncbi:hypothetical protein E1B28_003502 [Marasmius oreades]|uniref:Sulfotransferase n=1 Tax=Marasmius oreades TaxID=181124 RepID=A0A9P7RN59_9AGAR|nr:uncharacterized protein E1B28_003502 [Marasmius oreades]KAG7085978.1 hypothetical protein E1B28_003502 [Marasmius oreades]